MVHIRFTSLVLGLLFVMHALRDSPALAHQGGDTNRDQLAVSAENVVNAQKGLLDGITGLDTRKVGFGGRKMVVHRVLRKEMKKEKGLKGRTTKISGKDSDASKKSLGESQDQLNDQSKINMLEPRTLKSASLGIPKSEPVHLPNSTNPTHSQDSNTVKTKARLENPSRTDKQNSKRPNDTAQKGETQRLLEAAKEIVNLMNRDYKGMDRPGRKPPINNNEPRH